MKFLCLLKSKLSVKDLNSTLRNNGSVVSPQTDNGKAKCKQMKDFIHLYSAFQMFGLCRLCQEWLSSNQEITQRFQ